MKYLAAIACASLFACNGPDDTGPAGGGALSAAETARLVFTREEEKLARDTYAALAASGQEFVNIGASEQRHFDAIGGLLTSYQVADPAAGRAAGSFADPTLQALYDALVAQGQPGRAAALGVGCTVEDLDLRDLDRALAETDHADIAQVYSELARGSRNHLRSFYGQITAAGGAYTPQYIDQATFDAIVTSPHETGP